MTLLATTVALGGHTATIPVTVSNGLDQRVTVRLDLTPDMPRLRVRPLAPITVEPGAKKQVLVPVEALANGMVTVRGQLLSPSGRPFGEPVRIRVRIAEYGAVAGWITGGAAAVLFLAAARRLALRARAGRAARAARREGAAG